MKISIITVCKNAAACIEPALASVAAQRYSHVEYLVIDGASDDGTQEIVARYQKHIAHFVSEPDEGLYQAMNKGVRRATGDFLYFLNADDYLLDERVIEDVAHFLKKHPTCDVLYGNLETRSASGRKRLVEGPPPELVPEWLIDGCLPHQASFARARLFRRIGLFDERFRIAADYDWFLRLIQDGTAELRHINRTIASYYEQGQSSNAAVSVPEVFAIQDRAPLYQTEPWLRKRVRKHQELIAKLRLENDRLCRMIDRPDFRVAELLADLRQAQEEIAALKGGRLWKLRCAWYRLRHSLKRGRNTASKLAG